MFLLNINDLALTLRNNREVLYTEPAQALLGADGDLLFGNAALRAARLHPLDSNNSYLNRLSTEPLPRPLGAARNYADLVYQHLRTLVPTIGELPVCLSVAANISRDQLAVLLGISKEAGLNISAFVDSAVLAASALPPQGDFTYIDIHSQHLTLTRISHGHRAKRESQQILLGCGAQGIMDGWINLVADRFIQATRFDPLHSAASDQQLYNQLDQWRRNRNAANSDQQVENRELAIDIQIADDQRRAIIDEAQLLQKTAQRIAALDNALVADEPVLLSPVASQFPGLLEHLTERQTPVQCLRESALDHAISAHPELFAPGDAVRMLVELDVRAADNAVRNGEAPSQNASPKVTNTERATLTVDPTTSEPALVTDNGTDATATHLLCNGEARPIEQCLLDSSLPIARSGAAFRVMPSEVPLEAAEGQPLAVGHELQVGVRFRWQASDYQLIAVVGH